MSNNQTTVVGNLVRDPELRVAPSGNVRATLTIAVNDMPREGQDEGKAHFVNCTAFGNQAENVVESLSRGMRVVAVLRLDSYSRELFDAEGEAKNVNQIGFIVQHIGPELRFATAEVTKTTKSDGDSKPAAKKAAPAKKAAAPAKKAAAKPAASNDDF